MTLENKAGYNKAFRRFEEIKYADRGTEEHKEKMLLVHLVSEYETKAFPVPEINAIEMEKILREEFR